MLSSLKNMFKVPDLRNKILFTLLMIAALPARVAHPRARASTSTPCRQLEAPGRAGRRRARLPPAVLRRRAHPVRRVRARDHAVHHVVDHHADPHRGDPQARAVAAAGGGRPAQDHAVDPLPHDRHRPRCSPPAWPSCSTTAAAASGGGGNTTGLDLFADDFTPARVLARRAHPHRRHRPAHVDGRAHHPAGHRQRHVAADLRLGRVSRFPASGASSRPRRAPLCDDPRLVAGRRPARGHRVRRAGPAPHPRAVRQTGGGPADVRRPEHLHPAQGQPVGRDPDHLRQLGAVPAGAARPTSCPAGRAGAPRCSSSINDHLVQPDSPCYMSSTAC